MRSSTRVRSALSALLCVCSISPLATAQVAARFRALGSLDPDGAGPVIPYGVSLDGNVVVGESLSPIGFQAFRWTPAHGILALGAFPNPGGFRSSRARAASADGSVIVGGSALPNSLNEDGSPFRWTQSTGLVFLGSLGGTDGGIGRAVSDDGSVVAGYSSNVDLNIEAFRWTQAGGMVGLGDFPGATVSSVASGISGNGSTIVGSASGGGRGFIWTAASGMTDPGVGFGLIDISSDGSTIVGFSQGRALRLADGTPELLAHVPIPGLTTDTDQAWAVSANGGMITGLMNLSQSNDEFGRAFIWDPTNQSRILQTLLTQQFGIDLTGWDLNNATAVSGDGSVIAGYGFGPSGEQLGWVVALSDGTTGACCLPSGACTIDLRTNCDGAWFRAAVCSPNPCALVPDPTGICCAPDASCSIATRTSCSGLWSLGGVCDPLPCQAADPMGTCCFTFSTSCQITTEVECAFGEFTLDQTCTPNPCTGPTGSCCIGSSCTVTPLGQCTGQFQFFGVCTPNPCCPADFNHSGDVSVQDIFDFLAAYFAGDPAADMNGSATVTVQDIFDYLALYFVGCG